MKLVTYRSAPTQPPRLGVLQGDGALLCLTSRHAGDARFSSMAALIAAGEDALAQARRDAEAHRPGHPNEVPPGGYGLLTPLERPPLMRDWGTMTAHPKFFLAMRARQRAQASPDPAAALEAARQEGQLDLPANWFSVPRFYTANPLNLAGPGQAIEWPAFAQKLDYELELAIVLGRTGRDIPQHRARDFILGVTLFNDFTARDVQAAEGQPAGKSKDFDGAYALGPCIVTLDELPDLYQLRVTSRLNGETQTVDSTASMEIGFEDLIAYASRSCTLHAGEVFASGTFARGCGVETGRLLQPGDRIELEAEHIGILENTIVASGAALKGGA
ncbi:fumarylacetoacetate hydrolase family protein [Hydrogenophaga sp. UC242_50]|jgi:2-keto-4-pentenoate hydratase/2-oxohepta-3-ene-1,7-dioic acid hydratase in catechol pathway|uniref:fumarylacetoacetate hydrolase family protein n=1 Tax=unclassified Hydrogenophaga TaxID=2610897 RepID=UPI0036D220B2